MRTSFSKHIATSMVTVMVFALPAWQTSIAAAISALTIALATGNQLFKIASAARTKLYLAREKSKTRRKNTTTGFVTRAIPLPSANRDAYLKLSKKLTGLIAPLHEKSKAAQDRYYRALTSSLSSMVLAFIMLAANQAIFMNSEWFDLFANWLDMFAVVITYHTFLQASRYNKLWVKSRIQTELMRQRSVLISLKYRDFEAAEERWRREVTHIDETLSKCNDQNSLEDAIKLSSQQFRDEFVSLENDGIRIDTNYVRAYLHARVLSQLRWFGAAAESALNAEEIRGRLLRALFVLCVLVAAAKLAVTHYNSSSTAVSLLSFSSVLIFGSSVVMTVDHINQNRRSLSHQYRAQFRRIEAWIEDFVSSHGNFIHGKESEGRVVSDILIFEKMMTEELYAWLYISRGDRLALAP